MFCRLRSYIFFGVVWHFAAGSLNVKDVEVADVTTVRLIRGGEVFKSPSVVARENRNRICIIELGLQLSRIPNKPHVIQCY